MVNIKIYSYSGVISLLKMLLAQLLFILHAHRYCCSSKVCEYCSQCNRNFTCTAIAEEINWEVNGQPVDANLRSRGFDDEAVPLTLLNATQKLYSRTTAIAQNQYRFSRPTTESSNEPKYSELVTPFPVYIHQPVLGETL